MKIIFMGTPDFALPCLKTLLVSHHDVAAVVTVPDKPAGRGNKLRPSPVKLFALEHGIPVLQPEKFRDAEFLNSLRAFAADLFLVVAFRILPEEIFLMPPKGTVNLHASLLPAYRGAAPINWALINGEKETGVTTFFIEKKVDTGEILLQRKIEISPDMTAGELHDGLAAIGAKVLLETANGIESGSLHPIKQMGKVTQAPKISKELCRIDWAKSAQEIHNLVRGLSPLPASFTFFNGLYLKILRTKSETIFAAGRPGEILDVRKNGPIDVQTGNGVLSLLQVQPQGKRLMSAGEFSRGYRIKTGDMLGGE